MDKNSFDILSVVKGAAIGIAVTLAAAVITAIILTVADFSETVTLVLALVSLAAGVYCAGYFAAKSGKSRGIVYGLSSGLLTFLVFVLISSALGNDSFGGLFFVKLAVVAAVSSLGGIVGVNSASKCKIV